MIQEEVVEAKAFGDLIGQRSFEEDGPQTEFLTETELQRRERENILIALKKADWKIKGPGGASELLGVKPATLLSRMSKWGISKPAVEASSRSL